jgi:hypothetical protein
MFNIYKFTKRFVVNMSCYNSEWNILPYLSYLKHSWLYPSEIYHTVKFGFLMFIFTINYYPKGRI